MIVRSQCMHGWGCVEGASGKTACGNALGVMDIDEQRLLYSICPLTCDGESISVGRCML